MLVGPAVQCCTTMFLYHNDVLWQLREPAADAARYCLATSRRKRPESGNRATVAKPAAAAFQRCQDGRITIDIRRDTA